MMNRKLCVITGANAGIGREAAIQISSRGYHVILACRNPQRGEEALKEVRTKSGSDSVELLQLDMSLKKSIRNFATLIENKFDRVDVLIHNAAAFDISQKNPSFTEEDIESIWATNHVGPVCLTKAILHKLEQSPQGRIITIASQGLALKPKLQIDLEDPEFRKNRFSVPRAYYQSKLAQVMFTYWLAEKLRSTRITANCIRVTNVKIDINRYPDISLLYRLAYRIKSSFSITPEEMAEVYTYFAVSADVAGLTGQYFDHHKKVVKSSDYSCDKGNIEKLMNLTDRYLK